MQRFFKVNIIWLVLALIISACGEEKSKKDEDKSETEPTSASAERVLNFYNWDTYIDPQILTDFEEQYDVKINYTLFENNEDLYEEIKANPGYYDLIVPTDYMVFQMREEGLLAPINLENIPNFANVDDAFINPAYDPGNRYCMPYQWGTFGIGYDISVTGRELTSWDDLFGPSFKGQLALLDEARSSLGLVLIALGYSPNSESLAEINQARDFLIVNIDNIKVFAPDTGQDLLLADEVNLATEWSGDIFQVMEEDPNLRYSIPNEGSIIWTDSICIPTGAPHQELAEQFINYILEPQVGAQLSNFIQYGSPNKAAMEFINPEDLNNPALYPPQEVRERLFFQVNISADAAEFYTQAWAEVLAAHAEKAQTTE